jgi:hypothetical protein
MFSVLCLASGGREALEYFVKSYLNYVDNIVLVGKNLTTTHKNIFIVECDSNLIIDQKNKGLEKIKELNDGNGWVLVTSCDEIWSSEQFSNIKVLCNTMEKQGRLAACFNSINFVGDVNHHIKASCPKLYFTTKQAKFVGDDFMEWPDKDLSWFTPYVLKIPYISYFSFRRLNEYINDEVLDISGKLPDIVTLHPLNK